MIIFNLFNWLNENSASINLLTSIILAVATTIYVVFTVKLVKETRISRIQQLEPCLTFYLDTTETSATTWFIRILNIGNGTAYNVRFEILKDLDYKGQNKLEEIPLFKYGIKHFPSKHEFKYFLINVDSDTSRKIKDYIEFKVFFNDSLGKNYEELFQLKLRDIYGSGTLTPPETYIGRLAYCLEKIEKKL